MFTLYTDPMSANGRTVVALARHLELEHEVVEVRVYEGQGRTWYERMHALAAWDAINREPWVT